MGVVGKEHQCAPQHIDAMPGVVTHVIGGQRDAYGDPEEGGRHGLFYHLLNVLIVSWQGLVLALRGCLRSALQLILELGNVSVIGPKLEDIALNGPL